jgi:hypothetical protein
MGFSRFSKKARADNLEMELKRIGKSSHIQDQSDFELLSKLWPSWILSRYHIDL